MSKPWLSKGLLKSIRRKNRLYKRYINTPNDVNQASYKKYKNKLNHSLRIAKRIYYDKQLDYFKTNTKRTWQILNEVINRKKRTNKLTTTFVSNDKEISSPNEVAYHFCEYFTNIGINLAKDTPNSTVSHRSYLSCNYVNSMSLELTTEEEIVEITRNTCMQQPLALVFKTTIFSEHEVLEDCCYFYPLDIFAKKCENNENIMSFNYKIYNLHTFLVSNTLKMLI